MIEFPAKENKSRAGFEYRPCKFLVYVPYMTSTQHTMKPNTMSRVSNIHHILRVCRFFQCPLLKIVNEKRKNWWELGGKPVRGSRQGQRLLSEHRFIQFLIKMTNPHPLLKQFIVRVSHPCCCCKGWNRVIKVSVMMNESEINCALIRHLHIHTTLVRVSS